METLIELIGSGVFGGVFGGLLRFAPAVLDFFKTRQANAHEKDMMGLTMQRDKLLADQAIEKIRTQAQVVLDKGGLEALKQAIASQGAPTGTKLVDALSASVRPIVTYWYVCLYSLVKTSQLVVIVIGGFTIANVSGMDAVQTTAEIADRLAMAWTPADVSLFAGIMNFWFLDRVIRKNEGRL